jgi:hypothetical protein
MNQRIGEGHHGSKRQAGWPVVAARTSSLVEYRGQRRSLRRFRQIEKFCSLQSFQNVAAMLTLDDLAGAVAHRDRHREGAPDAFA